MIGYHDEILEEVRRNKEKLLEMYGGIAGLHEHMDAERPRLEKQGVKFVDINELKEKNYRRQIINIG
jgi:hypothetical protein